MTQWCEIPGGTFAIGSEAPYAHPEEAPVRTLSVDAFALDAHCVSNARFAAFVADSGHVTDAERYGWSFVFAGLLPDAAAATQAVAAAPWWRVVEGATWRYPEGPGSRSRDDHPVVHVSRGDALAYCAWAGVRLPSEVEWERAARGGLEGQPFPWGQELAPDGVWRCNVWQGDFPGHDSGEDGHRGTAPVDAFEAHGYGLHNMIGNVWEWTASAWGDEAVMRGGSYLCHASYCNRYRVSARSAAAPDSSTGNVGFRCASDAP